MGHDVFINHSSKDNTCANALVGHLERAGIRCWVAPRDLQPGANLAGSLLTAVAGSKLMVVVLSANSTSLPHILRLVERAAHDAIPIVALRIMPVDLSAGLQKFVKQSELIDAIGETFDTHLPRVTESIKHRLSHAPATAAVPPRAAVTAKEPPIPGLKAVTVPTFASLGTKEQPAPTAVVKAEVRSLPAADSAASAAVKTPPAPPKSKKRLQWVIGAVVLLAAAIVGSVVHFHSRSSAKLHPFPLVRAIPEPATAPAAPPTSTQPVFLASNASRDQRLKLLQLLAENNQLTPDQAAMASALLSGSPGSLSAYELARLTDVNNALEGRLPIPELAHSLDAMKHRQSKIDSLLATARANDNEDHDQAALAALNELLTLKPDDAAAVQLRDKINRYAPAKQHRMQQQAVEKAAADRRAKVESMLATALDDNDSGRGREGLALLEQVLKLDPANSSALSLRGTIGRSLKQSNSIGMTFAYIPAGTFLMGSPDAEPGRSADEVQHGVTLTKSFFLATTPVTQAQWAAVTGKRPSNFQGDDSPVEQVSYDEAVQFCVKLSMKEAKPYRLPTEAEWEYACRAGTTTPFNNGSDETALDDAAWYEANSGEQTHPVASKKPNAWGLYDMLGNVWQWCGDWYGEYPHEATTDPHGSSNPRDRVMRGGSWNDPMERCRSARRRYSAPDARYFAIGFRVALDAE
jgi:formylglycine-generating enzyme required for sulfatase activity